MAVGCIIWLTGLPCSGKTTLANILLSKNFLKSPILLDGDTLRQNYPEHKALGFSKEDRDKNVRMAGEKAIERAEVGSDVIVALVSPYEHIREEIREKHRGPFVLVHVDCPTEVCINRDVKGMWKKALSGEIKNFTGLDGVYQVPENPDVTVDTSKLSIEECTDAIMRKYEEKSRVILYIGRWSPPHKSHVHIIKQSLNEKRNVVVACRDTPITSVDPYTLDERIGMLRDIFEDGPLVNVYPFPFPNISNIRIGRKVGYSIDVVDAPEDVKSVSATMIRSMIENGDSSWEEYVPEAVVNFIKERHL